MRNNSKNLQQGIRAFGYFFSLIFSHSIGFISTAYIPGEHATVYLVFPGHLALFCWSIPLLAISDGFRWVSTGRLFIGQIEPVWSFDCWSVWAIVLLMSDLNLFGYYRIWQFRLVADFTWCFGRLLLLPMIVVACREKDRRSSVSFVDWCFTVLTYFVGFVDQLFFCSPLFIVLFIQQKLYLRFKKKETKRKRGLFRGSLSIFPNYHVRIHQNQPYFPCSCNKNTARCFNWWFAEHSSSI